MYTKQMTFTIVDRLEVGPKLREYQEAMALKLHLAIRTKKKVLLHIPSS